MNEKGIIEKNGNYQIRRTSFGEYLFYLALWLSIFIETVGWILTKNNGVNVILAANKILLIVFNVITIILNIAQIRSSEKMVRILCFFLDLVIIHVNAVCLVFRFPWPIVFSWEYIGLNYDYVLILIAFIKTILYFYNLCFVKTVINYYNLEYKGDTYQIDLAKHISTSIKGAKDGEPPYMLNLAAWYRGGINGFPTDLNKAMYWAEKASHNKAWKKYAIEEMNKIKEAREEAGFGIVESIMDLLENIFLN